MDEKDKPTFVPWNYYSEGDIEQRRTQLKAMIPDLEQRVMFVLDMGLAQVRWDIGELRGEDMVRIIRKWADRVIPYFEMHAKLEAENKDNG